MFWRKAVAHAHNDSPTFVSDSGAPASIICGRTECETSAVKVNYDRIGILCLSALGALSAWAGCLCNSSAAACVLVDCLFDSTGIDIMFMVPYVVEWFSLSLVLRWHIEIQVDISLLLTDCRFNGLRECWLPWAGRREPVKEHAQIHQHPPKLCLYV
jgi:hypothetical protein